MEKLIIQVTCGYMLKAIKFDIDISKFKREFSAIRHGNYYEFIELIKSPIPTVVVYSTKEAKEIDFVGLIQSGPSLLSFYKSCLSEYGELLDDDVSDDIYERLVLFEIGIRMHASNASLTSKGENLIDVINKLCDFKKLSTIEREQLQKGRRFLNMIKHFKNQFPSWEVGIHEFNLAFRVLEKYKFLVI